VYYLVFVSSAPVCLCLSVCSPLLPRSSLRNSHPCCYLLHSHLFLFLLLLVLLLYLYSFSSFFFFLISYLCYSSFSFFFF
ncbi:hypothetical protein F3J17_34330, partial [Burkholderia sp. Ax-1719]|nr:hypothetical protein [Burkholderia sp. Ax-1719]